MPKVIQDFIGVAAVVSALTMFFVFASNHWITSMESEVRELRAEAQDKKEKLAEMRTVISEVRDRLERIERKLDKAVHAP